MGPTGICQKWHKPHSSLDLVIALTAALGGTQGRGSRLLIAPLLPCQPLGPRPDTLPVSASSISPASRWYSCCEVPYTAASQASALGRARDMAGSSGSTSQACRRPTAQEHTIVCDEQFTAACCKTTGTHVHACNCPTNQFAVVAEGQTAYCIECSVVLTHCMLSVPHKRNAECVVGFHGTCTHMYTQREQTPYQHVTCAALTLTP